MHVLSLSLSLSVNLTSGLEMKEMASPFVPNLPALPTLCKYWSLCDERDKVLRRREMGRVQVCVREGFSLLNSSLPSPSLFPFYFLQIKFSYTVLLLLLPCHVHTVRTVCYVVNS